MAISGPATIWHLNATGFFIKPIVQPPMESFTVVHNIDQSPWLRIYCLHCKQQTFQQEVRLKWLVGFLKAGSYLIYTYVGSHLEYELLINSLIAVKQLLIRAIFIRNTNLTNLHNYTQCKYTVHLYNNFINTDYLYRFNVL